jgi:hypothetical protein
MKLIRKGSILTPDQEMVDAYPGSFPTLPKTQPIPLADLKARLELLSKHGVRFYRDGVLSIDLTTQKQTAGKTPQQEFPPVPEM